jgi:hypothetical protein
VECFVREAERRIKEQVKLPENYIVEFGGQFKNLQQARLRLAVGGGVFLSWTGRPELGVPWGSLAIVGRFLISGSVVPLMP